MMSQTSNAQFRIETADGLSKPYGLASLRRKRDRGAVRNSTRCTPDDGATWHTVGSLLTGGSLTPEEGSVQPLVEKPSTAPPRTSSRPSRLKAIRRPERSSSQDANVADDRADGSTAVSVPADAALLPLSEEHQPTDSLADILMPDLGRPEPASGENPSIGLTEGSPLLPLNSRPTVPAHQMPQPMAIPETYQIPDPVPATSERIAGLRIPPPESITAPKPLGPPPVVRSRAVSAAAAAALQAAEQAEHSPVVLPAHRPSPGRFVPADDDDELSDSDLDTVTTSRSSGASGARVVGLVVLVTTAVAAVGFIGWWFLGHDRPPTLAELGVRVPEDASGMEVLTLEELTARSRIMSMQLNRIARAVSTEDQTLTQQLAEISEVEATASAGMQIPLVPYVRRSETDSETASRQDLLSRYSRLVQQKGPDGRQLDRSSVDIYSGYLQQVMQITAATAPTRAAAVLELSEYSKLLYLLQLYDLRSGNVEQNRKARQLLLTTTNQGIAELYPEFAAQDLSFYDIYRLAEQPERTGLLLTRYWYHRAADRNAANRWLEGMQADLDQSQLSALECLIELNRDRRRMDLFRRMNFLRNDMPTPRHLFPIPFLKNFLDEADCWGSTTAPNELAWRSATSFRNTPAR
ncbi:MAG: hypothetical protein R3C49_27515 [Planctomycetaceae bacterium]